LDALAGDPAAPWRSAAKKGLEAVAGTYRDHGVMAAVYARAVDRLLRDPVKVTTGNAALARAALAANPYVVIEPGDDRAIVCVGTLCYAPVSDPVAVAEKVTRPCAEIA